MLARATAAWRAGRPHHAWQILATAGMADYWPEFRRQALALARTRYVRLMSRYTT